MQTYDWDEKFNEAYDTYNQAQYGYATLTSLQREDYALNFLDLISDFRDGGTSAQEILERELHDSDIIRRNVAGYILIETGNLERLSELSNALTKTENSKPILSDQVLKKLWIAAPPANGQKLFWEWILNNKFDRFPLLEALLATPTDAAFELCTKILTSGHSSVHSKGVADSFGEIAIQHLALWKQFDYLEKIIEQPPTEPSLMTRYGNTDLRTEAAFYLASNGYRSALTFLEISARDVDEYQAAMACRHLALLAQPRVVEKIKPLLTSDDGNIVAIVLDAVSYIKAIDLIADLLHLANREIYCDLFSEPLCDDAVRTISTILGQAAEPPPQERFIENTYGTFGGTYTPNYRQEAIKYYEQLSNTFRHGLRYKRGQLLTLNDLVNDLSSPHSGPYTTATFNLPAITGHHYGPNDGFIIDRIDNIKKILLWKEYVAKSTLLEPGGWAYQGYPIEYPKSAS